MITTVSRKVIRVSSAENCIRPQKSKDSFGLGGQHSKLIGHIIENGADKGGICKGDTKLSVHEKFSEYMQYICKVGVMAVCADRKSLQRN